MLQILEILARSKDYKNTLKGITEKVVEDPNFIRLTKGLEREKVEGLARTAVKTALRGLINKNFVTCAYDQNLESAGYSLTREGKEYIVMPVSNSSNKKIPEEVLDLYLRLER